MRQITEVIEVDHKKFMLTEDQEVHITKGEDQERRQAQVLAEEA